MSVRASSTVSMSPAAISAFSSSRVMAADRTLPAERPWRIMVVRPHQCPSSPPSSPVSSPSSAPLEGEPQPLDGGITNRNYRVRMGGEDLVLRLCDHGAEVLGIDRSDRGDRLAARRGRAHRPGGGRLPQRRAGARHALATGRRPHPRAGALARRPGPDRRDAAPAARHAGAAERRSPSSASSRSSARLARRLPDSYEGILEPTRTASRRRLTGPEHVAGLLPQRPADRQLRARRRRACASSTGSTRG